MGKETVPFSNTLLYTLIAVHNKLFNSNVVFPHDSGMAAVLVSQNRRIAVLIDSKLEIPQDKGLENEISNNKAYPAFFLPSQNGLTLNGESYEGLYFLYAEGFLKSIGDELGDIIFTGSEKRNSASMVSQTESIIVECLTHELRHEYQFFEKSKVLLNLDDFRAVFNPEEERRMIQKWNSLRNLYDENIELELDAFIVSNFAKFIWQKNLAKKEKLDLIKKNF